MDKAQFEERLMAHLENDSLVLTPVNVGFALELDATDAAGLMDELVAGGTLELVSGTGTGALYKRVGHATYETPPGEVAVGKPKSSQALYHLLLNTFFPGFGSLLYGRIALLIPCILLLGGAIAMIVLFSDGAKLFSILLFFAWWLVSFLGGIYYYLKDPWADKNALKKV